VLFFKIMKLPTDENSVKKGEMPTDETDFHRHLESRLSRTEQAVENLGAAFTDLKSSFNDSESRILTEIGKINDKQSNTGKTSWGFVVSCFSVLLLLVGWGMSQAKTSAVNEAVAEVHYKHQVGDNSTFREWSRRLRDDINHNSVKFQDYYEHREGLELERLMDDYVEDVHDIESRLSSVENEENKTAIAAVRNQLLNLEKRVSEMTAKLGSAEQQIGLHDSVIDKNSQAVSKLEPLTRDMGMQTLQGAVEELEILRALIFDIDNKGPRGWNGKNE